MNIERHNQIIAKIEADPESWNQKAWHCETKHCYAGYAQILSGKGSNNILVRHDARLWLQISKKEANYLFSRERTLEDLKNFTLYNLADYDRAGYDRAGYNRNGYDRDGYNQSGYDSDGYNLAGYDQDGYDRDGYNQSGYNLSGYDRTGYNRAGYNRAGYDLAGYDMAGYDIDGLKLVNGVWISRHETATEK